MTLNEYSTYLSSGDDRFRKSRLLIVPNPQDRQQLRMFYKQNQDARIIRLSEAIMTNAFVPMPSSVLLRLKELIRTANEDGKMACIIGLDGYLLLLDSDKMSEGHGVLRSILDDAGLHAVFLLSGINVRKTGSPLAHPRFHEEKSIIVIGDGIAEPRFSGEITFLRKEFLPSGHVAKASIRDFLNDVEDETLENGPICVYVDSAYDSIPGVNKSILQLLTLRNYMRVFWKLEDDVSDDTLQWLYDVLRHSETQGSALSILQNRFYPTGLYDCAISAPKKIREAFGVEKEVLVWMLKKTILHETYLYAVLSTEYPSLEHFTLYYVSTALDLLDSPHASAFSEERRKALKEIGHENLVSALTSFISQCRDKTTKQVAVWLNNGTDIEKQEIMRRVITDQGVEIPLVVRKSYLLLDAYLDNYKLGFETLDNYFTQYRTQKLKNGVSEEFCLRAAQEDIPADVPPRDGIIQSYAADPKTGLLVVDALGVEYVPMILALAQRRGTGIECMDVGYARLPTSTQYNPITWPKERKLHDVKHLDSIIHYGAEAHVAKPPEENLMAAFEAIEKYVLPAVEEGLLHYDRVILTSDHGASRLAVCAYEMGFTRTIDLPKDANVLDWRFSTAPTGVNCPETMTPSFCGEYWAVKGYNRLSKQGGKYHELHGGATLEERLVPVVAFVKGASFTPKPQRASRTTVTQLTEKDDFDL